MTPERWAEVRALFERVVDLDESERKQVLDTTAKTDPELHAEVLSLLDADEDDGFLDTALSDRRPATEPVDGRKTGYATDDMIGEYQVERSLGSGAFGAVYAVVHPVIKKRAAIKVLHPALSNRENLSRFIAEARTVNEIGHSNIVDIFGFGETDDGGHYFIMELLAGGSLQDKLQSKGTFTPDECLEVLQGLASALDAAHGAGVVHRDLKPANVVLSEGPDGTLTPKLLDFGIAKLDAERAKDHQTDTRSTLGTPAYMAPEQVRGGPIDHRADVYALGILTYHLLTGELPFRGETSVQTMVMHLERTPPKPSTKLAELARFDAVIARMLEKDPNARPTSASLAVAEFAKVLHTEPVAAAARSEPPVDAAAKVASRKTPWALVVGAVVFVVVGGLYFSRAQFSSVVAHPPPQATKGANVAQPTAADAALPSRVELSAKPSPVAVRFIGQPRVVEVVSRQSGVLGKSPGPIELAADTEHVLILRRRGYVSKSLKIRPNAESPEIRYTLDKRKTERAHDDLEPFPE